MCIDDIFVIWKGNYFLHNINKQRLTIKFNFVISKGTVSFFDRKIYIEIYRNIQITL